MSRELAIKPSALKELSDAPAHVRGALVAAIDLLATQAAVATRNRVELSGELVPHWEVRVGPYRVFYVFDAATVTIKAVRLKGGKQTKEVFKP